MERQVQEAAVAKEQAEQANRSLQQQLTESKRVVQSCSEELRTMEVSHDRISAFCSPSLCCVDRSLMGINGLIDQAKLQDAVETAGQFENSHDQLASALVEHVAALREPLQALQLSSAQWADHVRQFRLAR